MRFIIHSTASRAARLLVLAAVTGVAACGLLKPGTPGHEPPSDGRYNPVSGETNSGNR